MQTKHNMPNKRNLSAAGGAKSFSSANKRNLPTKQKPLYTTITTGIYKGRRLLLPSLDTTRSTKSIVRQSVFNSIRYELGGRCFVEVFGGSASMAIEALSNGAKSAVAIEIDRAAYEIMQRNAADFAALRTFCADSFEILHNIVDEGGQDEMILYLDPPFDMRDGFAGVYERLERLILGLNHSKIFKIIFEFCSSASLPDEIAGFSSAKSKKFGSTSIKIFNKI